MYKGAILNIQKYSTKASSCPDIYNNNSTLTVTSEPDSVSHKFSIEFFYVYHFLDSISCFCWRFYSTKNKKLPIYTFLQISCRDSFVKVINQLSNKRVNTVRRVRRKRSYFHPKTLKKVR